MGRRSSFFSKIVRRRLKKKAGPPSPPVSGSQPPPPFRVTSPSQQLIDSNNTSAINNVNNLDNSVVAAPVGKTKKKAGGSRLWMRFDRFGNSELMECEKSMIIKRVAIPARDLRILGPVFSHSSNILAREKAMVVNLEFIRAIVTAEEVLILDPLRQEVLPFVDQLRQQIPFKRSHNTLGGGQVEYQDNEMRSSTGRQWLPVPEAVEGVQYELPFEFQVLEIALEVVCTYLDSNVADLERDAYPVLDELARNVSTKNLEHVRSLKSNLTRLLARVQKEYVLLLILDLMLENTLFWFFENFIFPRLLNTCKLIEESFHHLAPFIAYLLYGVFAMVDGKVKGWMAQFLRDVFGPNFILNASLKNDAIHPPTQPSTITDIASVYGEHMEVRDEIEHLLDDNEDMAQLYLTRKWIQNQQSEALLGNAAANSIVAAGLPLSRLNSSRSASLVTGSTLDVNDVEELEMLLEAYFMQLDGTRNKILSVREYIDDTEDYVNIQLDNQRNELIQLQLTLTIASFAIALNTLIASIFGMNIPCRLYHVEGVFGVFVGSSSAGCFLVFLLILGYARWKKLLGS